MFVGVNDSLSVNAKLAVFQEPFSETTQVSSHLVHHEIYFRAEGDALLRRLQPDSYDRLILYSMRDTSTGEDVPHEEKPQPILETPSDTNVTKPQHLPLQYSGSDQLTGHPLVPDKSLVFQPGSSSIQPSGKESSHLSTTSSNLSSVPEPTDGSIQLTTEAGGMDPSHAGGDESTKFLTEAAGFEDFTKLFTHYKNKGMVEFFHVFNVGSHHHMNEILQIFVRNVSLCALVTDSSEDIQQKELDMLHANSFASKGMVVEVCADHEPILKKTASKTASLEHFSKFLIEKSSDPLSYIFSMNLRELSESDCNTGASILAHTSSSSSKTFPFSWYLFGFRLRLFMSSKGKSTASVSDECMTIAKGLAMDRPTVEAALEHLMEQNMILYFRDILNNTIFLDVQMFSQILERLFEKSIHSNSSFSLSAFEEVIVNKQVTIDDFLTLFTKLMIMAPYDDGTGTKHFIPCWLTVLDETDREKTCSSAGDYSLSPVYFKCPSNGYEFIAMLTVFLLSKPNGRWKILLSDRKYPVCLYKNCVKFDVDNRCIVTISFFMGCVEVNVKCQDKSEQNFYDISATVLQGLEKVKLILNSHQSFSFNMSFPCHCGRVENVHIAPYNTVDGILECVNGAVRVTPNSPIMKWLKSNKAGITGIGLETSGSVVNNEGY